MSLSTNNLALWEDIAAIYTTVKETQIKHDITPVITVPENLNGSKIKPDVITNLNNTMESVRTEGHIAGVVTTIGVTNPTTGSLIKTDIINTLKTKADEMYAVCHFCNFSSCDSCHGNDWGDTCYGGAGN